MSKSHEAVEKESLNRANSIYPKVTRLAPGTPVPPSDARKIPQGFRSVLTDNETLVIERLFRDSMGNESWDQVISLNLKTIDNGLHVAIFMLLTQGGEVRNPNG